MGLRTNPQATWFSSDLASVVFQGVLLGHLLPGLGDRTGSTEEDVSQ